MSQCEIPQRPPSQPNQSCDLPQNVTDTVTQMGTMHYDIDWFNAAWPKRLSLTINTGQIPTTQTNYQLKIKSTFSGLIGAVKEHFRFAKSDHISLPYQIVDFDSSTGSLFAYLLLPIVDNGDKIFIYYNNPNALSESDPFTVWADFLQANHLNNTPNDSTGNNNDLTVIGATPLTEQGYSLDGIDDNLENSIGGMTWFDVYSVRIEFELITSGNTGTLFIRDPTASDARCELVRMLADDKIEWRSDHKTFQQDYSLISPSALSIGKHTIVLNVTKNLTRQWFLDGIEIGNTFGDFKNTSDPDRYGYGMAFDGGGFQVKGNFLECNIIEISIKNSIRSTDLVTTEKNNETPGTFYTIGVAETVPSLDPMEYDEGEIMEYDI